MEFFRVISEAGFSHDDIVRISRNPQLAIKMHAAIESAEPEEPMYKCVEFLQALGEAGFSRDDFERVISDPQLAANVHEAIKRPAKVTPPEWYRDPEQQLRAAYLMWKNDIALPEPPDSFTPATETEVLLLHVQKSFDELWHRVSPPSKWRKECWQGILPNEQNLRVAPGKRVYTNALWLAFDPERNKDTPVDKLWGDPGLAGIEVLSAAVEFPDWVSSWGIGFCMNLAGCQLNCTGSWTSVPYLVASNDATGPRLVLSGHPAGNKIGNCASPSVRPVF